VAWIDHHGVDQKRSTGRTYNWIRPPQCFEQIAALDVCYNKIIDEKEKKMKYPGAETYQLSTHVEQYPRSDNDHRNF
jgi:hypothetical protein